MVPEKIVSHMSRNDVAANLLFNALGNQISLRHSYDLPLSVQGGLLPIAPSARHVIWLQFGSKVRWNSELRQQSKK